MRNPFFVFMKKKISVIFLFIFLNSCLAPAFAVSPMTEFLFELGLKFYQQGRYDDALAEFKKTLLVHPNYAPAMDYISIIEGRLKEPKQGVVLPSDFIPSSATTQAAIKDSLELIQLQKDIIRHRELLGPSVISLPPIIAGKEAVAVTGQERFLPPQEIFLDESFQDIRQPIDIQQGKSIVIKGKNIQRFLATEPDIITVEKKSSDELLVSGKNIGHTYLHIWDDSGRTTVEFLGVFPVPEGPTYEELVRREIETARNFKLRYSLSWSSYETGRRIDELERSPGYSWYHTIGLSGASPYGMIDGVTSVRRLKTGTDFTHYSLALTEGNIGPFKGFTLRGGDYTPGFTNLSFPGTSMLGAMISSPAFDKKIEYTAFWGRENASWSPALSPGIYKSRNAFLGGFDLSYSPFNKQNYRFSMIHGWGRDREDYLNKYGYDLSGNWILDKWRYGYEIAHDSQRLAQILNTGYAVSKMNFSAELRDIDKKFMNISGTGWNQGQLGGLINLNFTPSERLRIYNRLDVYRDRLYPAQEDPCRWNQDFDWSLDYQINQATGLALNYALQNDLGKLSQSRYQTGGFNLSRRFKFIRDVNTTIAYSRQENKSFSAPTASYINDRLSLGLRFNLTSALYYYINKDINWLQARYYGDRSIPHVLETGLDWSRQLGKSPFRGIARFTYRDEEDTLSSLSFLSGEDYIESYTELTYNRGDNRELFGSCRVRNSWADNPNVSKRIEASFHAGARYVWDTGVRWDAICNIEANVFKDYNSDGLRQKNEPPVEGIKLCLGKDKFKVTDIFGYAKFKGVRGRKVFVSIDMASIPRGFLLTVPGTQEVNVLHNQTIQVNFGIMSRSEIRGVVFEDINANEKLDKEEKAVEGVVIALEEGKTARSDNTGKYYFSQIPAGAHTVTIDLNSIPVQYLPKVALKKEITLFEGVSYQYNIPLRKIERR